MKKAKYKELYVIGLGLIGEGVGAANGIGFYEVGYLKKEKKIGSKIKPKDETEDRVLIVYTNLKAINSTIKKLNYLKTKMKETKPCKKSK